MNITANTAPALAAQPFVCQQRGALHAARGLPNEDTVCIRQRPHFAFYGIADGQSGRTHGAAGGQACLEALADYMEQHTIQTLSEARFPDEIPYRLMQEIRRCLLSLSASAQEPYEEFASTLLAVAVDPDTSRCMMIHLGDGCAVSVSQAGVAEVISPPDNGISGHYTWLTTSQYAACHVRVTFGSLRGRKRMLLMSDGAGCLCHGCNLSRRARELMIHGSGDDIAGYLAGDCPEDDATCVILDFKAVP